MAGSANAESLPPIGGDERRSAIPDCILKPGSQQSCARILACIGVDGLYFDGGAFGWDTGVVLGSRSDGVPCAGEWRSGGLFGSGTAKMECEDGLTVGAIYYSQDSETGTALGRGSDNLGRGIIAWSGENVLKYLTPDGRPSAELPCGPTPIPIS
ncbi:hypothetical protein [Thalassococcus lentus]|uniref:Uncharacterized protein n=1 Tax=Thalassococcus lentus TaxID=1210524 RepID=A0ABT4XP87_9RHOB|nr:hypothetical protein [Thalassococcus lentus]MDA7423759.1 hypothetical protein [Thalassococcus lentus]